MQGPRPAVAQGLRRGEPGDLAPARIHREASSLAIREEEPYRHHARKRFASRLGAHGTFQPTRRRRSRSCIRLWRRERMGRRRARTGLHTSPRPIGRFPRSSFKPIRGSFPQAADLRECQERPNALATAPGWISGDRGGDARNSHQGFTLVAVAGELDRGPAVRRVAPRPGIESLRTTATGRAPRSTRDFRRGWAAQASRSLCRVRRTLNAPPSSVRL